MEIPMTSVSCADCHIVFAITTDLHGRLRKCHNTFYCPIGHSNYFPAKSDVEILKEKLSLEQRKVIELKDALEKKTKKVVRKTTKAKANGKH